MQIQKISTREELFRVFRLIQEKDAGEFYAVHSGHYIEALSTIQYLFFTLLTVKAAAPSYNMQESDFGNLKDLYTVRELSVVCSEIAKHQKKWLTGAYSKNDFFDLVFHHVPSRKL